MRVAFLVVALLAVSAYGKIYFQENFDDGEGWKERWVIPTGWKSEGELGEMEVATGDWYGDEEVNAGLLLTEDAKFYGASIVLDEPFDNEGKDLVLQYVVKNQKKLSCGGRYIKLLPTEIDQENFGGDHAYEVMFGPDQCGPSNRRVHTIFNYNDENHLVKRDISPSQDQLSHVYRLVVHPDNTYALFIDGDEKQSGNLADDFDFLAPEFIDDPDDFQPEDWDDREYIDDPEDVKPEDWDDEPEFIADADAEVPEDWDEELDGEWEAPMVPNPEYKGAWAAKKIENPDYQGVWTPAQLPNPEYQPDDMLYHHVVGGVGFELWTVEGEGLLDCILLTDSIEEADAAADACWGATHEAEKEMWDEAEEIRKAEEEEARKAREAEMAAAEEDDDDDVDEHDEL